MNYFATYYPSIDFICRPKHLSQTMPKWQLYNVSVDGCPTLSMSAMSAVNNKQRNIIKYKIRRENGQAYLINYKTFNNAKHSGSLKLFNLSFDRMRQKLEKCCQAWNCQTTTDLEGEKGNWYYKSDMRQKQRAFQDDETNAQLSADFWFLQWLIFWHNIVKIDPTTLLFVLSQIKSHLMRSIPKNTKKKKVTLALGRKEETERPSSLAWDEMRHS